MEDKRHHQGREQVQRSRGNIDFIIRSTNEDLGVTRFKNEKRQKDTRLDDESRRQERYEEIQSESIGSNKKNSALEMKWAELKDQEECEELNRLIEQQKSIFGKIIEGKDHLIRVFLDELNKKDDEYGKMIKEEASDIHLLIKTMRLQFFDLRERIMSELENIETNFIDERNQLLGSQQSEVKGLFDKHSNMEKRFVEERDEREEEFTRKIETLRIEGAKSYAELKISMETEIQNLEKCYEDMKALYQLNTEKLDYNLKVLREKQEENTHLQDELKRKDQQLNNRLRKLTKDYIDFDNKFKKINKEYTQQYKRITRQFKELQRKFKHFEKADSERYSQIQKMNEIEVKKLKDKITKADLTIHIQQLGMQWSEPHSDTEKDHSKIQQTTQKLDQEQATVNQDDFDFPIPDEKLTEIMDILLIEVDFLIDDKLRENLEESNLRTSLQSKLDVIKKCMNIDSIDEMIMFLEQFVQKCRLKSSEENMLESNSNGHQMNSSNGTGQQQPHQQPANPNNQQPPKTNKDQKQQEAADEQVEESDLPDYENFTINQNSVIDFLMFWMESSEQRKLNLEKMSSKRAVKQETERQKKERIAKEGKKYWEKLTQVLPERTFRVWKVIKLFFYTIQKILDAALSKYYELLLQRQKLIEETGSIHSQNEELKNLMNQYLQINHELIIPPTRLIKLDQVQQQ